MKVIYYEHPQFTHGKRVLKHADLSIGTMRKYYISEHTPLTVLKQLKIICDVCNGTGKVNKQTGLMQTPNCKNCNGTGKISK
jgi:RecJ-like exonuclease